VLGATQFTDSIGGIGRWRLCPDVGRVPDQDTRLAWVAVMERLQLAATSVHFVQREHLDICDVTPGQHCSSNL